MGSKNGTRAREGSPPLQEGTVEGGVLRGADGDLRKGHRVMDSQACRGQ